MKVRCFGHAMPAVLETGLNFIKSNNPDNLPCVKGYNIINGKLALASDENTFKSTNPANKNDCLGVFPLSKYSSVLGMNRLFF